MNLPGRGNTITLQLILLIALSFCFSTGVFLIAAHYVSYGYLAKTIYPGNFPLTTYNSVILLIFLLSIGTFIGIFILPVNKKLRYINYITKEVRGLALRPDSGFEIAVKGNDELTELAQSINSLSRELKHQFEQERREESLKQELMTNISHDLRSPLTSIMGYLDLLKKRHYKTEADFEEYVDTIYSKSQNLKVLIDELLEYAQLSSTGIILDYQQVDLSSLLKQMIGEHIPILAREGLEISTDIPEEAEAIIDVEKIVRVLLNLLDNARKYSSKPSLLKAALVRSSENIKITLFNNVDDLPAQPPETLFERFYKGDSARSEEKSSGLGLAISKKIIELHGGSIEARYLNKGIEFVIQLPVDPGSRS